MSTMMKAMRFVGDLDDDFYKDERQRDVWNEASAVGLQSVFWAIFVSSAILPWVAGRTGAWISLALLIVALFGSLITIIYALRCDVDVYVLSNYKPPPGRDRHRAVPRRRSRHHGASQIRFLRRIVYLGRRSRRRNCRWRHRNRGSQASPAASQATRSGRRTSLNSGSLPSTTESIELVKSCQVNRSRVTSKR